jgi:hypothetical protein
MTTIARPEPRDPWHAAPNPGHLRAIALAQRLQPAHIRYRPARGSPTRLVTRTRPGRLERIHPAPEPGRPSAAGRRAIDLGWGPAACGAAPRKYLRDSVRSR